MRHTPADHLDRMSPIRARLTDVQATAAKLLAGDAQASAGSNTLLSRDEQAKAPAHVQAAATALRGTPGARVTVDALEARLAEDARSLIAGVNQSSGSGRTWVSQAEVRAAEAADPALGGRVLKAWAITTGRAADVDAVAIEKVSSMVSDADSVFKQFSSEMTAMSFQDPKGRQTVWLVKTGEDAGKSSYVLGRNDLWAERFDVDATSGAITTTGEH